MKWSNSAFSALGFSRPEAEGVRFHDVYEDIIESRRLQARGEGIWINDHHSVEQMEQTKRAGLRHHSGRQLAVGRLPPSSSCVQQASRRKTGLRASPARPAQGADTNSAVSRRARPQKVGSW